MFVICKAHILKYIAFAIVSPHIYSNQPILIDHFIRLINKYVSLKECDIQEPILHISLHCLSTLILNLHLLSGIMYLLSYLHHI